MKKKSIYLLLISVFFSVQSQSASLKTSENQDQCWAKEKATVWYAALPWLSGCNFQPSSAINQIEMWQNSSFDAPTIDKELGWAEELGFNTMRVFLSSVVWNAEPDVFKRNIDKFLTISAKHNIRPMFVFFDDCWKQESAIGKQEAPKPGVHNSGWVQDPSVSLRADTAKLYPQLEKYVKDILKTFKNDKRILLWDLYNEPGNSGHGISSLALVRNLFKWAREVNPIQPLSVGVWTFGCPELNVFQVQNSDVITYHNYASIGEHEMWVNLLKTHNRPMICTEYMARRNDSKFQNIMPMLSRNNVGAINWGFVSGKTNTIFAWDEPKPNEKEPVLWFHDIYRQDKTPFDQAEVDVIKKMNAK
ncbi:MAG: glycoside hydrolase family 2 TIM barrel-domain containing protein [Paludibacter sp.]